MLKISLFLFALTLSTLAQAAETFALKDFAQFGIQAKAVKLVDPRFKSLAEPEDRYYLQVKLGRLSLEQYNSMMALYGNKSRVAYDAEKEYELVDFLHPAMQATVNQVFGYNSYDTSGLTDFDPESVPEDDIMVIWPLQKNGVASYSNCWNTTTQILRLQHHSTDPNNMLYQIYWPGRWDINDELKSDEISSAVAAGQERVGDALLVSAAGGMDEALDSSGMIQHTAILLSESLVFEKTDSSEDDPYRISFRQDVLTKYQRVFESGLRVSYRRYNQAGQNTFSLAKPFLLKDSLTAKTFALIQKLVPAIANIPLVAGCETGLGGGCDVSTSELHEFKVVTNPKTGRGIFYGPRKVLDRFFPLKGK
jgi:hypothetical protein